MEQVLEGVRVLDYGRFIAAPWCSAILADMGADVVRVGKREGGEDRWVQSVTEGGEGATFLQCNRNKRSLTLDSTTPEGAEVTRRLVAGAFGHPRLQEFIFGGATRTLLNSERPSLFLSH